MSTTRLSQTPGSQPMQEGRSSTGQWMPDSDLRPGSPPLPPSGPAWTTSSAPVFVQAWRTLRKRPVWLLGGLLLGLLTGIVLAHRQPVLYRATARILISGAGSRLRFNAHASNTASAVQVADQAIRIKDDTVLNQLIADLDLMNDGHGAHASPTARAALLRQLRASIQVRIVPQTRIVSISFVSVDPRFTAQLVNKLVDDFTQRLYQEHFEAAERAMQMPAAQLDQLKAEVQATQNQMIQVQRRLGNTGFASEYSREDKNLDTLTRQAVEARNERDELQQQYARLLTLSPQARQLALDAAPAAALGPVPQARASSSSTSQSAPGDDATGAAVSTRLERQQSMADLAALSATLGPANPQRKALQAQVDELDQQLARNRARQLEDLHTRALLARRHAAATDAALAAALGQAYGEGGDTLLYRKLLREFTFTRTLYVRLYTKLRTAAVNAGLNSIQVELVDAAQVPGSPLPGGGWLLLLKYTLGGLLLGATISLALENWRSGLRTALEVEAVTDLPSLATLPFLKLAQGINLDGVSTVRRNLTALDQPSSPFAEGLRILRLNLDLSGPGAEPRYILFTSSTPSEGKTTVAGNYAIVLAERGERVLLIDADMHRPNLHHRFGLSGRRGLSTALSGQCTWQDAAQPIPEVRNLDLLVAGPVPPSPAALLAGPALLTLLRQAGRVYTHIVLDSPPVMAVNDGIMLSQLVDAVVFVVRHGKIDKRLVRLGRERLTRSGAPLAGIVFNGSLAPDDANTH